MRDLGIAVGILALGAVFCVAVFLFLGLFGTMSGGF